MPTITYVSATYSPMLYNIATFVPSCDIPLNLYERYMSHQFLIPPFHLTWRFLSHPFVSCLFMSSRFEFRMAVGLDLQVC